MKGNKLLAILLSCVLTAGAMAGCSKGEGGSPSGTESGQSGTATGQKTITVEQSAIPFDADAHGELTMDAVQEVNMATGIPSEIDVSKGGARALMTETNEGLIRIFTDDKGDVIVPAGAESWEISDDGLNYTFHLRKNAKWSDGVAVTAQNYVDSWLYQLDREQAFDYAYLLFPIVGGEEYYNGTGKMEDVAVRAADDYTLEVTLKEATPQFIKQLIIISTYPIRKDLLDAAGGTYGSDHTKQAYNGPFMIVDWVKESSITLKKNPYYWDADNVYIETVNQRKIDEVATQAQMFDNGELDWMKAEGDYVQKWTKAAEEGKVTAIIAPYAATFWMCFNHKTGGPSGLMQNKNIRRAISLAIDREEFVDTVYGRYSPALGMIPIGMQNGDTEFRSVVEEPLKAEYEQYFGKNEELQEIFKQGLSELGINKDLSEIELTYIATGATNTDKSVQEYFKQSLENKLGIKINLNVVGDYNLLKDLRTKGEFDIEFTGWYGDYNDPMDYMDLFNSTSGFTDSYGSYKSDKYDALHASLKGLNDMDERQKIYVEMEKLLVSEDYAIAPVYYMDTRTFFQPYVKNVFAPLFGGGGLDYSRAYISGK